MMLAKMKSFDQITKQIKQILDRTELSIVVLNKIENLLNQYYEWCQEIEHDVDKYHLYARWYCRTKNNGRHLVVIQYFRLSRPVLYFDIYQHLKHYEIY